MSCTSPFTLELEVTDEVLSEQETTLQGCYTVPGYSTPSYNICTPYWVPGYPCCWYCCGKAWGCCVCYAPGWKSGYTGWYCYTIPGVELWPSLQFCGSVSIPWEITASTGVEFTVNKPPEAYQAVGITLKECDVDANVNGSGFTINLITEEIELEEKNGEFLTTIDLGGFSNDVDIGLVKYSLDIDSQLLLCLEPVPPMGWINVILDCTMKAVETGIGSESVSFKIAMPIVSVDG